MIAQTLVSPAKKLCQFKAHEEKDSLPARWLVNASLPEFIEQNRTPHSGVDSEPIVHEQRAKSSQGERNESLLHRPISRLVSRRPSRCASRRRREHRCSCTARLEQLHPANRQRQSWKWFQTDNCN